MLEKKKERIVKFIIPLTEKRHKALIINKANTMKSMELQINEAIDKYLKI